MSVFPSHLMPLAVLALLLPAPAFAAAATASQNVNVRSGPATTYPVVGQLQQGDTLDVRQCEGDFCQIVSGTRAGWVSATYITRDFVAKPTLPAAPGTITTTPPIIAAAPVAKPVAPPLTPSSDQVATATLPAPAQPGARMPTLPAGTFPPAYDDNANALAEGDDTVGPRSSVDLPDDGSDSVIASTDGGVPRPQADVPGGRRSGPDDEFASDDSASDEALPGDGDNTDGGPVFAHHYRMGPFPNRGRFAALSVGDRVGRACFFAAPGVGAGGFCIREGETVADLGEWSERLVAMRNPEGLRVTICMDAGLRDCRVFDQSGPLNLPGNLPIDTIHVDAPRD